MFEHSVQLPRPPMLTQSEMNVFVELFGVVGLLEWVLRGGLQRFRLECQVAVGFSRTDSARLDCRFVAAESEW